MVQDAIAFLHFCTIIGCLGRLSAVFNATELAKGEKGMGVFSTVSCQSYGVQQDLHGSLGKARAWVA
ncbi:hypothetical protein DM02DRAFT_357294 [Periconia macrospinosa]|uniref:Uncharacterized protein n=1 Tax=Periconia macrospinosa TaxID=97972 RepID=A0A2V1EC40_9PLEO|nr:hypothetical protein DM02DRAFT_357294 [Periconia macrospinosa]